MAKCGFYIHLTRVICGGFINVSFIVQFHLAIPILTTKRCPWISTALEAKRTGGPSSTTRLQKLLPSRWGWCCKREYNLDLKCFYHVNSLIKLILFVFGVIFRSSACKMIRTLVQLMRTLEKMPEEVKKFKCSEW